MLSEKTINTLRERPFIDIVLSMVIVGTVIGFENSQAFGCFAIIGTWSLSGWLMSLISIALLFLARSSKGKVKIVLVILELVFWTIKLITFKGGYVFGFAGTINLMCATYDFVALALRMELLRRLTLYSTNHRIWIILLSGLMIVVKSHFFAVPWYTEYKWSEYEEKISRIRSALNGNYRGQRIDGTKSDIVDINVKIDSTYLVFETPPTSTILKSCQIDLNDQDSGYITLENHNDYPFYIIMADKDSLVLRIESTHEHMYYLRLKKAQ